MASSSRAASTSGGDFFFGWDLLYKTVQKEVNKESDVLIALAHFLLMKYSNFRCIGVGEDKTVTEDENGSELLPDGWNDNENYALRYLYNNNLYLLLANKTENCIIINLMDIKTKKVSNIALEPNHWVKKFQGSIDQMVPDASQLVERYRTELVDPVFEGTTKEVTTQTSASSSDTRPDPLRIGEPRRPMGQFIPVGGEPRPFGFPDVGRGDLDPLGRLGPGNLLQFPSHPDIRGGGVGPRYDPFGPPDPNIRPNPNPDHFRPPDFGHDYYM